MVQGRVDLEGARRHSQMSHALFSLLILNGLRVSEAVGADVEHLEKLLEEGTRLHVRQVQQPGGRPSLGCS